MMKHQGSSYCCRWFTLLLVATGIVLVSPDIHMTFAGYNKQTTKGKGSTTTTNAMRAIKTLEAMGFIDANRYNANKNSNNNNRNINSYNTSMDAVNSRNRHMSIKRNSVKGNTTNIEVPIEDVWSEDLEKELDHRERFEQNTEYLEERAKHMLSTPQSMTITVEKPTMVKQVTTTKPTRTTASTIAASKPTTAITMATKAMRKHSDSAIKMPTPDNGANINVNGIKIDEMMYKQMLYEQHEQQQKYHEKMSHQQQPQQKGQRLYWQQERHRQQEPHWPVTALTVSNSRKEQKSHLHVANALLDSKTTITTPSKNVDAGLTKTTIQMLMVISSNNNNYSNSSNNIYRNTANVRITTTTAIAPTMITTTTTTTAKTTTKKPQSHSAIHISYYNNVDANNNIKSELAQETDVQMVVATSAAAAKEMELEMEVDRQYKHKFSSTYLDDVHNYAPLLRWQQPPSQHINRWTRQVAADEEEPVDKCRQFIEGEGEKNEFYSPDYPNDYPKNINCTRKIIAPKGQIIRLDFRNSFHIEAKEDCKFDFLEIRDGQYGFSPLIGKFCGTDFPPEITSKERYLWLHFHSDESIEYSGFTAVYEFIDRSKEAPTTDLNCTIEKDGFEGFVNSTDVPYDIRETVIKTKIPLDCIWRIQVQDNWKIQVKFLDFKLSKPNDCDTNFLDIFPEKTVMPLRLKNFCGSAGEGITSESNVLNLRFFAEPAAINSTFSILFTAFRDRGAACTEDEYDCEDATCISLELKCNDRDNCKFRWDEEGCKPPSSEQSEHMIIIMIVFGLILGGMIITFLVNCIRKLMHDQKIIREHIRQSKESKLNELGRSSKARSRDNLSSTMPRTKHSQTSLHILDDTSNRYYREVIPMSHTTSKVDLKEREHSILRHRNDMIVQTSFCGDDNSSEATIEAQQQAAISNACDMGCQTRESLFATPTLMHQSSMGSLKDKTSLHSRSRFSTFGYEAPQPTPPPLPIGGHIHQLTGLNIRDAQEYIEMRERHPAPKPSMPHMHRMDALPPTPPTAATLPEMCHHHHQHAHTHVHTQQQQQQHPYSQQPSAQQQLSMQQQSKESTTTGRSTTATATATTTTTPAQGKVKPKLSQSTAYIDIRNSAPDVIIMTSH